MRVHTVMMSSKPAPPGRFTAERNYKGFLSEPVRLNTADLNLDRSGSVAGNSGGDDGVGAIQPNGAPLRAPAKRPAPAKKPPAKKPGRSSGTTSACSCVV